MHLQVNAKALMNGLIGEKRILLLFVVSGYGVDLILKHAILVSMGIQALQDGLRNHIWLS